MRSPLELAAVCEDGSAPDRALEIEIWTTNGGVCPPGRKPLDWLHCYTSRVDAALDLCDQAEASDVLREAVSRIGARFSLHVRQWPEEVPYRSVLARFVTAACLRRIDATRRRGTDEDIDLRYVELRDGHIRIANTYRSADERVVSEAGLDRNPMGRVWDAIVEMLLREGTISKAPGRATIAMVQAGQAAYDRKNDDCWSQSPTEEPEAGGGPTGYAWRAMAAVYQKGLTS
jgi:hypothetical protein